MTYNNYYFDYIIINIKLNWTERKFFSVCLVYSSLKLELFIVSGGLFHPADDKQEVAFRYAVDKINNDRSILPRSKLSAQIEKMSPQDSFHASKKGKGYS